MKRPPRRHERVSQREYEALAAFRSALREFLAFSESAAREAGLTPRQHQALLAIKGLPDGQSPTVGDLAGRLGVRHHSAVGLVDRLTTLGLLERRIPGPDHRRVRLVLTRRGRRTLERLAAVHRDELRQVAPRLQALVSELEKGPLARRRRRS